MKTLYTIHKTNNRGTAQRCTGKVEKDVEHDARIT